MMARLGAIPSRRADQFPVVFQHDSPLLPEQCGGPITDLEGNVIGINISRNNRSASYAIPSAHIEKVLPRLREQWNGNE
jgi:serine protease Do